MTALLGIDLTGRAVVVAGAGDVGTRRGEALAMAGADVLLIDPTPSAAAELLAADGRFRIERRVVAPGDVVGTWLVVAATGDPTVNAEVSAWADAARVWCINAGDAGAGSARWPAQTDQAGLVLGATSAGPPDPARASAALDAFAAAIAAGGVDLRRRRAAGGRVTLVGSGPGDPGLMTLRGRAALASADVVIADRLGDRSALADLPADVTVVEVGKAPGAHSATQEEINALLVEHALAGRQVVRLKGGDPFVFGRGGEEVQACADAGIPVEVVPGVTSAFAAPALAGIPVTHREVARSVMVTTGHAGAEPAAARAVADGATLVVLMGVAHLADVCRAALEAGAPPGLPVAIVESGGSPDQRVTVGTLVDIEVFAAETGVKPPAVIVVGEVARPGFLAAGGAAGKAGEDARGAVAGNGAAG